MYRETTVPETFSSIFHNLSPHVIGSQCLTFASYCIVVTTSPSDGEKEQWEGVEQTDG